MLKELSWETANLIRYCRSTIRGLMSYHENYRNSFCIRLLHWLAIARRDRTELYDRRLKECAIWMDIATITTFLHANHDVALEIARRPYGYHANHRAGSDFLKRCQGFARQLGRAITAASEYSERHPERMRHMEQVVNLGIFRSYWGNCNETFLELPRSQLPSTYDLPVRAAPSRPPRPISEIRQQPEPRPFIPPVAQAENRQHLLPTPPIPDYGPADEVGYPAAQPRQEQDFTPLRPRAPSPHQRPARSRPRSRSLQSTHIGHREDPAQPEAREGRPPTVNRENLPPRQPQVVLATSTSQQSLPPPLP